MHELNHVTELFESKMELENFTHALA